MTPLPCPFCGSKAITFRPSYRQRIQVLCALCGAEGPEKPTHNTAVEAWNAAMRAMQPEVA